MQATHQCPNQGCPHVFDEFACEDLGTHTKRCKFRVVHCSLKGCSLTFQRRFKKRHESRCDFAPSQCRNEACSAVVLRKNLAVHEGDCPFFKIGRGRYFQKAEHIHHRKTEVRSAGPIGSSPGCRTTPPTDPMHPRPPAQRCSHEGCVMTIVAEGIPEHEASCDYGTEACRNDIWGCPDTMLRMDLPEHELHECQYRPQRCPNACGATLPACGITTVPLLHPSV